MPLSKFTHLSFPLNTKFQNSRGNKIRSASLSVFSFPFILPHHQPCFFGLNIPTCFTLSCFCCCFPWKWKETEIPTECAIYSDMQHKYLFHLSSNFIYLHFKVIIKPNILLRKQMQSNKITSFLQFYQSNCQHPCGFGLFSIFAPTEELPLLLSSQFIPHVYLKAIVLQLSLCSSAPLISHSKTISISIKTGLHCTHFKKEEKISHDPLSAPLSQQDFLIKYIRKTQLLYLLLLPHITKMIKTF